MQFRDLDYLSISDRLRAHAWWLFFDPDHAGCEELRQRSNERLREYNSFDVFIAPEFSNTTTFCCAEYVRAQLGYLQYGPESIMLMAMLSEHLLNTIKSDVYQALLRKADLRLARKIP